MIDGDFFLSLAGQVVSAEILMASEHGCPIEMHRIQIEKCDEMYDEQCDGQTFMPFHRASYDPNTGQSPNNPREQVGGWVRWSGTLAIVLVLPHEMEY